MGMEIFITYMNLDTVLSFLKGVKRKQNAELFTCQIMQFVQVQDKL